MRDWGVVGLAIGLALALSAAQAATSTLPPGAVLIDERTAKSDPARLAIDAAAVLARVARGDDAGALAQLQAIDDPLAFELTAARVIHGLSASGAGEELLSSLESVAPRVFRRHEETKADWFLPVFDLAGQARSLRDVRARQREAEELRAALLADPAGALEREGAWSEAISALPAADLDRVSDAVVAKDSAASPALLVALAARSKRTDVWERALDAGAPVDVLPLFEQVHAQLPAGAAKAWLDRAARDPRYASAAVLASARVTGDALITQLDDPLLGASAASALARRDGDAFLARVDALTDGKATPARLRHVALALRLIGTPAADERLRRLAEDPRLPAHLRTELQR